MIFGRLLAAGDSNFSIPTAAVAADILVDKELDTGKGGILQHATQPRLLGWSESSKTDGSHVAIVVVVIHSFAQSISFVIYLWTLQATTAAAPFRSIAIGPDKDIEYNGHKTDIYGKPFPLSGSGT